MNDIVLVAVVIAAKYFFSKDEENARSNWNNKKSEAEKTIKEHQAFIDEHLQKAEESYDFHHLTGIHFSSMIVANESYQLLKDARITLNGIGTLLSKSIKHKKNLQAQIETKGIPNKKELIDELNALNQMRKGFFNERDITKKEQDEIFKKVQNLNQGTRDLKIHIKDNCGSTGTDWYERMEHKRKTGEKLPKKQKERPKSSSERTKSTDFGIYSVLGSIFLK
jgi:hypothetical protein